MTPLSKPLSECRVTMLTSGGISQCSMPAWDPMSRNDHRLDAIPNDADVEDFQIHDAYYDHADADADLNCQFPIDRLRELADTGEIGSVADRFWSGFMGRIYNRTKVLEESAPAFAAELAGGRSRSSNRGPRLTPRSPDRRSGLPSRRGDRDRNRVRVHRPRSHRSSPAAAQLVRQPSDGQRLRRSGRHCGLSLRCSRQRSILRSPRKSAARSSMRPSRGTRISEYAPGAYKM